MQRFGGALNLNVHFHVLLPDAVFILGQDDTFKIVPLPPPEDQDVLRLAQKLARRVTALLDKRYATIDEGEGDGARWRHRRGDEPSPDAAPGQR